jgi:hypothetical protein
MDRMWLLMLSLDNNQDFKLTQLNGLTLNKIYKWRCLYSAISAPKQTQSAGVNIQMYRGRFCRGFEPESPACQSATLTTGQTPASVSSNGVGVKLKLLIDIKSDYLRWDRSLKAHLPHRKQKHIEERLQMRTQSCLSNSHVRSLNVCIVEGAVAQFSARSYCPPPLFF